MPVEHAVSRYITKSTLCKALSCPSLSACVQDGEFPVSLSGYQPCELLI